MRLHNVTRFIQSVRRGACVEIGPAFARRGVEQKAGVRTLRHAKDFADLAFQAHELVQFHFLPVLDPEIISIRVNVFERDMRIADGLQKVRAYRFAGRELNVRLRRLTTAFRTVLAVPIFAVLAVVCGAAWERSGCRSRAAKRWLACRDRERAASVLS